MPLSPAPSSTTPRAGPWSLLAGMLLFAVACALIYRLRGGGFGVNEWKPIAVHSRFIAWLPQTLLYIVAVRRVSRRPVRDGVVLGLLWLIAVLPGWGGWFDIGTFRGRLEDGYEIPWVDRVLDFSFGPLAGYMGQTREAWRDATGMAFRGLYFWPLMIFAARTMTSKVRWDRALLWCGAWTILYPLCYAVGHRWWLAGPNPEYYTGFVLGLATFPVSPFSESQRPGDV